jgi:3-hydroxy-3-methylglutaryl CoA synthase
MWMANSPGIIGIEAFGVFVPRRRISRKVIAQAHAWAFPGMRGKGEKAICNWDEDALTMAVEAARDCLGDGRGLAPAALTFASTSAPFADLQNAALIASALNLGSGLACSDLSGSTRCGLSALASSLEQAPAKRLVVASERRVARPASPQEMQYGCAAAAFVTGDGEPVARYLGREATTVPFIDHFRQHGSDYDYAWEERWVRDEGVAKLVPEAIARLLRRLGRAPADVSHLGIAGVVAAGAKLVAQKLGTDPQALLPDLQERIGDAGSAHGPLLLVSALERARPGELIVVAAFGQGCEVLAFEMGESPRRPRSGLAAAVDRGVAEPSYLKMLSADGQIELDWGPRAEVDVKAALTQMYRSADQVLGFIGGKCRHCGAAQFPRLPNCVQCGAYESQDPYPLSGESARIATYSIDWLQYHPAPPLYVGLVQFESGARVLMEIVDVGDGGIEVGTPLRMRFRIKAKDGKRHFDRYFWKAAPAS